MKQSQTFKVPVTAFISIKRKITRQTKRYVFIILQVGSILFIQDMQYENKVGLLGYCRRFLGVSVKFSYWMNFVCAKNIGV